MVDAETIGRPRKRVPGRIHNRIIVREVQPEKVLAELSQFRGKVLRTSLSPEQEARLQAALSKT